jgi:hypothetical protein
MRTWLIRILIAVAIIAVIVYVARHTEWETTTVPVPLGGEARTNPFYAAQRLSRELGAIPERRFAVGELDDTTDVLVLSNWNWHLIEERRSVIEAWVEAGGHLVVDGTLYDDGSFEDWSGVSWTYLEDGAEDDEEIEDAETSIAPPTGIAAPAGSCDVLSEVDREGYILTNARTFSVCTLDDEVTLDTEHAIEWGLANDRYLHAARVRLGRGSVTVLNMTPFGNRDLTTDDHGRLFVAATQLQRGTRIAFLAESERASLLELIWVYGAPAVVLMLLTIAALLWRTSARFGPLAPEAPRTRRSLADQIRGTGRFAIRLGDGRALHAAAVRALQEAARRRIPGYDALAQPERIAAIATATGFDADALGSAINHTGPRRSLELAHTIAVLENARRKLLEHA